MMLLAGCIIFAVVGVVCGQTVESAVAFEAAVGKNLILENGETLVLKKILINYGDGYNNKTGVFTAPKSGIYQFQMHARTTERAGFWLDLYHNGSYVISAFARQLEGHGTAGNSAILSLKKDDTVQLKVRGLAFFFGKPAEIFTTFSGHFIGQLREGDSA